MDPRSDVELAREAAATVSEPRRDRPDSFVLHAPLELAARFGLLGWVRPADRARARERIAAVAEGIGAFGPPAEPPRRPLAVDDPADAARHLAGAIAAGDLDGADAAATALAAVARPADLPALLADTVVPRLAAAGHAPIFLHLLPRVAPRGELPVSLLRPLARELARHPDWRLTWFEPPAAPTDAIAATTAPAAGDGPATLDEAIRAVPRQNLAGSTSIHPTMSSLEGSGVPAALLGRAVAATPPAGAARTLARLAARAMLAEPADHARYGWSHALTMPQGVLSVAGACTRPAAAVAVAATYLAGFRAELGTVDLATPYEPEPAAGDLAWALADDPASAPAAVWHTPADRLDTVRPTLASAASRRHDAHLLKYTLACFDAAETDPSATRLYLAAAARLLALWIAEPDPLD